MTLHHATAKKLASLAITMVQDGDTYNAQIDGVTFESGTDEKAVAKAAIEAASADDFDIEAFREDGNETDGDQTEGEGETEGEGGSVVKAKYRAKYKEIGANDSNGDALALALRAALAVPAKDAKEGSKATELDEAALATIAEANGVTVPSNGRNPGHTRMIFGNILRGLWKKGKDIDVLGTMIEATPEAKERGAALFAKEKAKEERKAQPKQTKEERAAKAKAKREANKAAKAKANPVADEPKAAAKTNAKDATKKARARKAK